MSYYAYLEMKKKGSGRLNVLPKVKPRVIQPNPMLIPLSISCHRLPAPLIYLKKKKTFDLLPVGKVLGFFLEVQRDSLPMETN